MTAAELIAKQDRQLRIDAHVQADRRANRRDRDLLHGNAYQPPYGVVEPSTYKKHPQTIRQAARRFTSYISRRLGIRKRPHQVVIRSVPAPVRPMRHTSRRRAQVREGYWPAFCDLAAIGLIFGLFMVVFWLERGTFSGL